MRSIVITDKMRRAMDMAGEALATLVVARKKHVEAVSAYNARRVLVLAERERGNHSMRLDNEYIAMSEAQSNFIKTAQDVADAALLTVGVNE